MVSIYIVVVKSKMMVDGQAGYYQSNMWCSKETFSLLYVL